MEKSKEGMVSDAFSVQEGEMVSFSMEPGDAVARAISDFLVGLPEKRRNDSKNPFIVELNRINTAGNPGGVALDGNAYAEQSIAGLQKCMEELEVKRQSRRGNRLLQKIAPFLEGFRNMMKVCESASQAAPLGTGLALSGARVVLELAVSFHQYFEDLVDALHAIGNHLACYAIHAETFKSLPDFQNRLVRSYSRIFDFWYKASRNLSKATRATFSLVGKTLYQEMKEAVEALKEDYFYIQGLAMAHYMRQGNDKREHDDRVSFRNWILGERSNEVDVRVDLEGKQHYRQAGTCTWIFEDARFAQWRDSKEQAVLWYNGPPGSGKSVLTSAIIEHLQERNQNVAYFFFSFSDNLRKQGISGLRSLILQLLSLFSTKLPDRFKDLCREEMNRMGGLHNKKVATELVHELVKTKDVFIVVDGLDECVDMDVPEEEESGRYRPDMLQYLEEMIQQTTYGGDRWLFTSRNKHPKIRETMERIDAVEIKADSSVIMKDIQAFLSANLPCTHTIAEYTEGEDNFLYAWILYKTLSGKGNPRPSDIEKELRVFPKALNDYFTRSLEKIAEHTPSKQEFARRLFLLLTRSKQSVTFNEVIDALSLVPGAKDYDPMNVPRDGRALIEELCGPLVEFDSHGSGSEDNPIVKLCHKSVQDYLRQNPHKDPKISERLHRFFAPRSMAAGIELGLNCVEYLMYKRYAEYQDLDSLLDKNPKEHAFLRYAATFWCQHLFSVHPTAEVCAKVERFLKSKAFWTCLSIQSRVAPFLFGFYSHRKTGSFRMGIRGSECFGDDSFGVPLPEWLDEHMPDLDRSFCAFVSEWREVLVTRPQGLNSCLPLRDLPKDKTCHLVPLTKDKASKPLKVANLEQVLSLDDIATIHVFELYFQGRKPVVDLLYRNKSDPPDQIQQIQVPIFRDKEPQKIGILRRTHSLSPAEDGRDWIFLTGHGVSQDTLEVWQMNRQTLQLRRAPWGASQELTSPMLLPGGDTEKSGREWELVGTASSSNTPGSAVRLFYLSRNKATRDLASRDEEIDSDSDESESDSDSTATASSSEEEGELSNDYGSDGDSEISPDEALNEGSQAAKLESASADDGSEEATDCLLVIPHGKPQIRVTWTTGLNHWTKIVPTMHPTLPLVAVTHSPIELELINLESGGRKRINLPELADITETPAAYSRELRFSPCGNYLHLLLLSFFHQGFCTRCVVKMSTFKFNSGNNNGGSDTLIREFQAQSCNFVIATHLAQMPAPLSLTCWADGCVIVALPPLTCDPKVLKIVLATNRAQPDHQETASASCDETGGIFTLKEQIYFPTSTPRRYPSLVYSSMANGWDGMHLALGPLLPSPNDDNSNEVDPTEACDGPSQTSPPVVLRWKVPQQDGWRAWNAKVDESSFEDNDSQNTLRRLRGSFVESQKSFTVPIRCGLNWTRKGFLSCG